MRKKVEVNQNKIYQGDALAVLKTLPDGFVDCIITSPPYYGLRDYGVEGQLGLEPTLEEFIDKMLLITAELKRVLKKTGTLWWNHGDSYAGSGKGYGDKQADPKFKSILRGGGTARSRTLRPERSDIPAKSLMLQAHRLAIRMIDEQGWILRNQIIWHKPNVMPASIKDRFTVDYEPILFFTKSKKYFFEKQFEPLKEETQKDKRVVEGYKNIRGRSWDKDPNSVHTAMGSMKVSLLGRNKRSVWKIATKPYSEAHFATFPFDLIETPIKAGCPEMICNKCATAREKIFEASGKTLGKGWHDHSDDLVKGMQGRGGVPDDPDYKVEFKGYTDCGCNAGWRGGIVLDPFMGSGTTAFVARQLGRKYLGIELNPEYIKLANKRLSQKVLDF